MSRVDGQWIRIDSHAVILTDGSHPPNLRQPSTSSRMDPIREVIDTIGTATDGSHPRDLRQPSTSSRMDTIRETFGKCEWTSFEKSAGFLLSACSGCVPSSWCSACDLPAYDVPSTLASPSNRSWTTLDSVAPLLLSCWIASPKLSRGESIREAIERHGCIPSARGGTSRVEEGRVGWGYGGRFINILIHQLFFGFGSADRHYVSIPHPEEIAKSQFAAITCFGGTFICSPAEYLTKVAGPDYIRLNGGSVSSNGAGQSTAVSSNSNAGTRTSSVTSAASITSAISLSMLTSSTSISLLKGCSQGYCGPYKLSRGDSNFADAFHITTKPNSSRSPITSESGSHPRIARIIR
ncbi:hypothetical protein BDN71DRAFT_1434348 [Pleurotus eryngii]|uniref:Uncharacterized protein n=1 Tax=Pleurotus eryngii TaxID=5323 RepID=A0A9P5ZSD0_PLEER|nr:hypothetical protein BDN71DRAFT_1434348 [Pleurotus eryngii]